MKNLDNQARSNVLKQLIAMMGESMANRKQNSALQIEIKPSNSSNELTDEDCPHCDGDGCRFCG